MNIYYSPRIQAPFKTLGFYGIVVFKQRTNFTVLMYCFPLLHFYCLIFLWSIKVLYCNCRWLLLTFVLFCSPQENDEPDHVAVIIFVIFLHLIRIL